MKLADLNQLISLLKSKKVAVTTHRHADIDAIVSAYLIKRHVEKAGGKADILIYEGTNTDAENIMGIYGIEIVRVKDERELERYDKIIVVDTQSVEQIEIMREKKAYVVIDHHEKSATLINAEHYFINSSAVANAQHLMWLLDLDKEEKELVAIAFISDTFRFKRFDKIAAREFATLLEEVEKSYEELLKLAFPRRKKEEKLTILKALKKAEYEEEGEFIISYTLTEESTGEVASMLTNFSDVAIVMKKNSNGKTSVSIRCDEFFPLELNKIAEKIGKELKGAGGGHKKAAGALIEEAPETAIKKAVSIIKNELKKHNTMRSS